MENYRSFHKFRADRTGVGVSILLHDSVMFRKLIDVPLNGSFECCAMEVNFKGHGFCISETYRPPNTIDSQFIENFIVLLNKTKDYKYSFHAGSSIMTY